MKILIALTYYRPHYSGLTIYTERLARALVKRGHDVTVLTSRFDNTLPLDEMVNGVRVLRVPVAFRLSKGVIMPTMPLRAIQEIRKADLVNLHLPQLDAAPMALSSRLMGKPVVVTYHCDLKLPEGFVNRLANFASDSANFISAQIAKTIVTNTQDYAEHSPFLGGYLDKVVAIPPPVTLSSTSEAAIVALREKYGIKPADRVVGMVARLASEKGAEYLVRAMPSVIEKFPDARVIYAGQHENVMGEEAYSQMLLPLISELGDRWKFLGLISDEELAAFFHVCDVVVVPSTNSTESFGIVQVEAMTCGTPAIASDMPGMRQPVIKTGMGTIFPAHDVDQLSASLKAILGEPEKYKGDVPAITQRYSPETIATEYEKIFEDLLS